MNINFEEIFIEHCSPLLAGIKISNLFSIKSESYSELYKKVYALNKNINKKDIYVEIIEKKKYFQFFLSYFCLQKNEIRRKSQ